MADQGKSKEVYYFSGGFRCTVLQEYHISSTRKHENYRETKRNAYKVLKIVTHCILKFDSTVWKSLWTKLLHSKGFRENAIKEELVKLFSHCRNAVTTQLHLLFFLMEKRNDYNMEADNFPRIFCVSGHTKKNRE